MASISYGTVTIRTHLANSADLRRNMDLRGERVKQAARGFVGVQTGRLLATIRANPTVHNGLPAVEVHAGQRGRTPYLMPHHDGSRPHRIIAKPNRPRASLRFVQGGRVVFVTRPRYVNHPGTRGSQFLRLALRSAKL